MYNIQFLVFSTVGPEATQLISWDGNSCRPEMPLVLRGHFAEGDGEHYVCLQANEDFIQERLFFTDSLQPEDDHHSCLTDDYALVDDAMSVRSAVNVQEYEEETHFQQAHVLDDHVSVQ